MTRRNETTHAHDRRHARAHTTGHARVSDDEYYGIVDLFFFSLNLMSTHVFPALRRRLSHGRTSIHSIHPSIDGWMHRVRRAAVGDGRPAKLVASKLYYVVKYRVMTIDLPGWVYLIYMYMCPV